VRNRAGKSIEPTIASTTAAAAGSVKAMQKDVRVSIVNAEGEDARPIAGFTYLLVYQHSRNADNGRAVQDFLTWAIHDSQKYAAPLLYAPLPREIVALNEAKIEAMTF
jgi:phosphate transport system substrate-binding protein